MRWYKQDTNVYDRCWTKDSKAVTVYLYLHCAAYVNDGIWHGQLIRRGSCPTSRSAIMEATGLSEYDVKSRLKLLVSCGEILVKISNAGTIVTCCDYDSSVAQESLFEQNMSSELPTQLPSELPNELPSQLPTHIYNRITDITDNKILRSHYIPSKKERESGKSLVYEIKEVYNKTFSGQLIAWKRLSEKMIMKVETCIQRFGRQSVDMVFDQIKHEPFSLGENNTGFKADFDFIFKVDQYEKYLERYKLRMSKKPAQPPAASEPQQSSIYDRQEETPQEKRKLLLINWVEAEARKKTDIGQALLMASYNNGELQKFGIEWEPNKA